MLFMMMISFEFYARSLNKEKKYLDGFENGKAILNKISCQFFGREVKGWKGMKVFHLFSTFSLPAPL